ncbi:MAG: transposase family protein [Lachnospiraceae bacterium]|nr:transposase family protein [Lachnospiraceae bacterium]
MGKIKNTLSDIDPDIIICDAVIQTTKKGTTIKRISIKTKERSRLCPHCNSADCNINDSSKKRTVKHTPQSRVATVISFIQRRFLCKHCKVTFMEHLDWLHPDLGIT